MEQASNLQDEGCPPATAGPSDKEEQQPQQESTNQRGMKRCYPEDQAEVNTSSTDYENSLFSVVWEGLEATVTLHPLESSQYTEYRLCIEGQARVTCLQGDNLSILGHQLLPNQSVEVTSPSWSSLLTVSYRSALSSEPIQLPSQDVARIRLESIRPPQDGNSGNMPSFQLIEPTNPTARPIIVPSTWTKAVDHLIQDWRSEASLLDECGDRHFDQDTTTLRQPARAVVCGAKGVGKSTCVRYTASRLLQYYDRIAIIDADVGQPEFAPPGLLSLVVVSHPLLQPPHLHLIQNKSGTAPTISTVSRFFYRSVTSKVDPTRYMDGLSVLLEKYQNELTSDGDERQLPLIVNLDGWVKGMGYEVLTALLSTVLQPSHVLQLIGETHSKRFDLQDSLPLVSPRSQIEENNKQADESNNHYFSKSKKDDGDANPSKMTLLVLDACTNSSIIETRDASSNPPWTIAPSSIPPSTLRELRLGVYFVPGIELWDSKWRNWTVGKLRKQQGWMDDACTLAKVLAAERPYVVPFDAVDICFVGADRQDVNAHTEVLLDALNANVVGLCTNKDNGGSSPSQWDCLGLGIVRTIDKSNQLLYILTPVDPNLLSSVTTLVGGNYELPLSFHFRGVHAESFPYLDLSSSSALPPTQETDALGTDPMKSRNNILRKGARSSK